jgi:hypothetical protein
VTTNKKYRGSILSPHGTIWERNLEYFGGTSVFCNREVENEEDFCLKNGALFLWYIKLIFPTRGDLDGI